MIVLNNIVLNPSKIFIIYISNFEGSLSYKIKENLCDSLKSNLKFFWRLDEVKDAILSDDNLFFEIPSENLRKEN